MNEPVRALVVEDSRVLGRLIAASLRGLGCEITNSWRCDDALDRLRNGEADLAIVDIYLLDGSGIDLVKEARKMDDSPAIIVLTADARIRTLEEAKDAGADIVMTKPFRRDELRDAVRRLTAQN